MKIPVLIEATSEQCYRAMGGESFAGSVEAETPEAALEKLKKLIDDRVAQGARIVVLDLPDVANPWLEGAEMFRDDPLFDDWQRAIADYRREANQIVDVP